MLLPKAVGGESVLFVQYLVALPSPFSQFTLSNSNSMSLTIRMQRIFANDWNFVGMERTERAKLKKNRVLASRSLLACNMADISNSAVLRRLAGEGPPPPLPGKLFDGVVIVAVDPKLA